MANSFNRHRPFPRRQKLDSAPHDSLRWVKNLPHQSGELEEQQENYDGWNE